MTDNITKNITEFLNKEYLEYAFSVLEERAIPSLTDGFKPGGRKIIHASLAGTTKDGKLYKLLALSGDAMRVSLYSHGDASLNASIVGLCKYFNDNLNPLASDSQIGSLRDPDSAGAPRYLYVKHSKYMDLVYKTDYDLLDFVFEEGQTVEPKNYLPIIPTLLCKNNIGVAVGYAMHNQAYNPLNVIDVCSEILSKGKHKTMLSPYVRGSNPKNWRYVDGKWFNYGECKCNQSKDLLTITDLPVDTSYEAFEKLLNKLVDNEFIKDWKNKSTGGSIYYEIQFPTKGLSVEIKKDPTIISLANKFKLIKEVPDDLLWVLDENHKLKYFNNVYELIEYFVSWRLEIYTERKKKLVKILEEKYKNNSELVRFIELVCAGKLKIRNRSKVDIKIDMDGYKLPIGLISTPMSKCTIEERDELLKQNEEIKKELEYIRNTSEKQMYLNDLEKLRKELENDFPDFTPSNDTTIKAEVTGEAKKTADEKKLEKEKQQQEKLKAKQEKEKAKAAKDKEKAKKTKEKEKAAKEKEKASKQKDKDKKQKTKLAIAKLKETQDKLKTKLAVAKAKKNKELIAELNEKIKANKEKLEQLKISLK